MFFCNYIHYHIFTLKEQRKIEIEPRIKLNYNIYMTLRDTFNITESHLILIKKCKSDLLLTQGSRCEVYL